MNQRAAKLIRRIGGRRKEKRAWNSLSHAERGKQRVYLEDTMAEGYAPVRSYDGMPRGAYLLRLCLSKHQLRQSVRAHAAA